MNNPFEKALQYAQGIGNNIGQALPVLGSSIMQDVKQGTQNITNMFRKKKSIQKPNQPQQPQQTIPGMIGQIRQGANNEKQQLNQINKLTQ